MTLAVKVALNPNTTNHSMITFSAVHDTFKWRDQLLPAILPPIPNRLGARWSLSI